MTAEAAAESARDQLLLTLGLPVDSPVVLVGELAPPEGALFQTVGLAAASARANFSAMRPASQLSMSKAASSNSR